MLDNQAIIYSFFVLINVLHSKNVKEKEVVYIKKNSNDDKTNNILHKIHIKLCDILTKLCDIFNVNLISSKTEHFKLLVAVYHDLKPILNGLPSFYSNITQAIREEFPNMPIDQIKTYNQVIEDTLHQTSEAETDKMPIVSEEMLELVKIVHNLTFDDVFGTYDKTVEKDINKAIRRILNRKKVYNFKKWRQSNSSEFANQNSSRRVFRSRETTINNYPFIVSIHVMGEFMCAGSIISKDLIITAASCLQSAPDKAILGSHPEELTARIGSNFSKRDGVLIPIIDIYVHPDYNLVLLKNNIAIARMSRYNHKNILKIRRIEYARMEGQLPDVVNKIEILGWGDKENPEPNSPQLLSITHLDMVDINSCKKSYSRNFVTNKNFCAGVIRRNEGTCKRDMGGPAIVSSVLVGVISFGPPICGAPNAPTVFTNIGDYADWIDSIASLRHTTTLSSKQSVRDQNMKFTETSLDKKQKKLRKRKSLDKYPHAVILLTSLISGIIHKTHSKSRSGKFEYQFKKHEHKDTVNVNPQDIIQILSHNPKILKHYVNIVKSWLRSGGSNDGVDLFHDFEPEHFWATTTQRLHEVDKMNPTEPSVVSSALYASIEENTDEDQSRRSTTLSLQNYKSLADMVMSVSPFTFPTQSVLLDMVAQIPHPSHKLDESLEDVLADLEQIAAALYDPEELKKQIKIENKKIHYDLQEAIKHHLGVRKGKKKLLHNTFTRHLETESRGTTMVLPKKTTNMKILGNAVSQEYRNENYETDYDRNKDYNFAGRQNYNQFEQPMKNVERSDLKIQEFPDLVLQYDNNKNMQNRYHRNRKSTLSKPKKVISKNPKMATQNAFTNEYETLFQQTGMSFTAGPEYPLDYDTFPQNANQYGDGEEISHEKKLEDYLLKLNV